MQIPCWRWVLTANLLALDRVGSWQMRKGWCVMKGKQIISAHPTQPGQQNKGAQLKRSHWSGGRAGKELEKRSLIGTTESASCISGGKKGCRSYLLRRGSQDWARRRWIQMLPPPASPLKENFALCKIKEPSVGQAGTTASSTHTPMEVNRSLDVSSWNRGWDEMHKWTASAITLWARIQQRTKSSAIIGKITPWKACS